VSAARRLSAIMFTDMVGFTSQTQSDEAGTLELLREEEDLVRPLIEEHHGRAVKSTGDGFLAEFPSALEAARCAVAIQKVLRERNRGSAVPIELRIGIHLGDVEQRNEDIFGDAVNIAARVQPTADVGGVSVSQQVFDQIRNKLDLPLEKLGPKSLKGLRFPMDLYRVVLPWNVTGAGAAARDPAENRLAVLPFSNISPDPHDAYFSDGLTEEVITVLSQLGGLRVIARTSIDAYKAQPKPIPQVGAELGVRWVLEGSVRKAGSRLRITAQLIDVGSQEHLWASTYDRELDDVFALQSEMAKQIADALKIQLLAKEEALLDRRTLPQPESYLEYLQGRSCLSGVTETRWREARAHFERAIALDERNASAHAGLADVESMLGSLYHHVPDVEWRAASRRHAARALELDPDLAEAHTSLALVHYDLNEYSAAEKEFLVALRLNPSLAWARLWYATILEVFGSVDGALRELTLAEQLDPLSPLILSEKISLLIMLERYDEAVPLLEKLGRVENQGILYHDRYTGLLLARKDYEGYRHELELLGTLLPDRPELTAAYANYYALTNDPSKARELLRTLEALPEPTRPDFHIGMVYAVLGDLGACFHWFEVARAETKLAVRTVRLEPTLAHVRADPRFGALLQKLNLSV